MAVTEDLIGKDGTGVCRIVRCDFPVSVRRREGRLKRVILVAGHAPSALVEMDRAFRPGQFQDQVRLSEVLFFDAADGATVSRALTDPRSWRTNLAVSTAEGPEHVG